MLTAFVTLKPLFYLAAFLFLIWAIKHSKLAYEEYKTKKAAKTPTPNNDSWYYDIRNAYFSYFTVEDGEEDWEDVRKQLR